MLRVWLFGTCIDAKWTRNDKSYGSTRAYFTVGFERNGVDYSVLFQHYREGFDFKAHTDGVKSNRALTLVLNKPKRGGEFFVNGPCRRWLGGRVIAFDGGKHEHGVTRIEQGTRTVLMFQRGQYGS